MLDPDRRLKVALLLLRLSLGGFLLLWGIDKLVAPFATMITFQAFYRVDIDSTLAMAAGVLETVLALAIIAGSVKTLSYGLGVLLHSVSVVVTHRQWLDPFGENHLFIAALPLLGAFIVLFMLRRQDTLWSLDHRRRRLADKTDNGG